MPDLRTPGDKELAEDRKIQVIQWRRERVPFDEIGRRLDPPVSKQRAHQIYAEALRQLPAMTVAEYRAEQEELLDELERRARAVADRDHVAVSQGRVVRVGEPYIDAETGRAKIDEGRGGPVLDDMPKLAAVDRLLKIAERRAKLRGMDTPVRQEFAVDTTVKHIVEAEGFQTGDLT